MFLMHWQCEAARWVFPYGHVYLSVFKCHLSDVPYIYLALCQFCFYQASVYDTVTAHYFQPESQGVP